MKKLIGIICIISIFVLTLCSCEIYTPADTYFDIKDNAQEGANQMASDVMENVEQFGQFIPDISGNVNTIPPEATTHLENDIVLVKYSVTKVVDGDTFYAKPINGTQEEKIRLIGVDTPESVATGENAYKNCDEGKEASNFTKNLINGKVVELEFDVAKTDDYGRTLAYVYIDGVMLNKTLLEEGMARIMTIPPNVKYIEDFSKTQENARNQNKGFWKDFDQWE